MKRRDERRGQRLTRIYPVSSSPNNLSLLEQATHKPIFLLENNLADGYLVGASARKS